MIATNIILSIITPFLDFFFGVDTCYVVRDDFYFQAMLKNNYSYEEYRITNSEGETMRFAPESQLKIGPSIGYSVLVLGMSIDVLHLSEKNKRKEWDMSFYTMPCVFDFYWRDSGDSYTNGFHTSVTGLDAYYTFNHKRFSYPAAFNQTTLQRRSAGSPIVGMGFTRHSIDMSIEGLPDQLFYTDLSLSGGYAYNWVIAKNWLFAGSLALALSNKRTVTESERGLDAIGNQLTSLTDIRISDVTIDGTGRFGVVYN